MASQEKFTKHFLKTNINPPQTFPKNNTWGETYHIPWGQELAWYQNQTKGHHKKIKVQANITTIIDLKILKNIMEAKFNNTLKDHTSWSTGIYSGLIQGWFNICKANNLIYHINNMKEKIIQCPQQIQKKHVTKPNIHLW